MKPRKVDDKKFVRLVVGTSCALELDEGGSTFQLGKLNWEF